METTKDKFKKIYSGFRAIEGRDGPVFQYVRGVVREEISRLPEGARVALEGKNQPRLSGGSESVYKRAEQIVQTAESVGGKTICFDMTVVAERVCYNVAQSALDRMEVIENKRKQNRSAEDVFESICEWKERN